MSKKNLLNESQVRQFMKLAQLEPLTPGFVDGLTEGDDAEELEELRTGRSGALAPADGTHPLRGRGQGEAHSGAMNEADEESELHATEDELGDMDAEADREGDEIDDLEADLDAADAGDGRMVDVDDFLSALESALEGVLGDEVEIDADEMAPEEDEVEMDVELDAADDVEDVDVDVEDEMLQEGDDEDLEEGTKKGQKIKTGPHKGEKAFVGPSKGQHTKSGGKAWESPTKGQKITQGPHKGQEAYKGPSKGELDKPEKGPKAKSPGYRPKAYGQKASTNESAEATDDLVEQITKRVAARILKSALAKK